MDSLQWLTSVPYGQALGWTLIHSIWQFTLISLVARLLLVLIPRNLPNLRYILLLASLGVGVMWSAQTWKSEYQLAKHAHSHEMIVENGGLIAEGVEALPTEVISEEEAVLPIQESTSSWMSIFNRGALTAKVGPYLPLITLVWYIGVLIMSIYTLLGFAYLYRLKTRDVMLPDAKWKMVFEELTAKMGVFKDVQFLFTEKLQEPVTFYLLKPVVLVPLSLCTGMDPKQVEVLVLHELAHIRRNDFFVNLIQSVIEILFFFHPAVWWISGKIREEREHGCDDMVLKVQKDPMVYAEALTKLKITFRPQKTRLAMAAKSKTSAFSQRIFRLFGQYDQRPQFVKGSLIALLLLMTLVFQAFRFPGPKVDIHTTSHGPEKPFSETLATLPEPEAEPVPTADPMPVEKKTAFMGQWPNTTPKAEAVPTPQAIQELVASDEEPDVDMLVDAIHNNMIGVAKYLVEQGVEVNQIGHQGFTPLGEAAYHDLTEMVEFLLDNGADLELKDEDERTALIVAASQCASKTANFLLEKGANIDAVDDEGHSPLMHAAQMGNFSLVKSLLDAGADKDLVCKGGDTALSSAMREGYEDIVLLLLGKEVNPKDRSERLPKRKNRRNSQGSHSIQGKAETYGMGENPEWKTPRESLIENSQPIGELPEGIKGNLDISANGTYSVSFSKIEEKMKTKLTIESLEGETVKTIFSGTLGKGTNTLSWSMSKFPYRTYWMVIDVEGKELRQKIGRNTTSDWKNLSAAVGTRY